jgi:hypothetical protein
VIGPLRRSLAQRFPERDDPHRPESAQPRLFDASPRNALRVPFLDAVFGDATFAYVHRDPSVALAEALAIWESGEAVTYPELPGWRGPAWSFLLVPGWEELSGHELPEIVTEQWARTVGILLDDLEPLAPERWCVTEYESLLADPTGELARLFRFLGLPWEARFTGPLARAARSRTAAPGLSHRRELEPFLARTEESSRRAAEWIARRRPL